MTNESKIYWSVGVISVAILLGAFLFPSERPKKEELPWHIEHPTPDSVRVFGVTLGLTTPAEAEQLFKEHVEAGLFKSPDGRLAAEVFFEQINLAGLRSRVVLTVAIPDEELQQMYERGLRMTATGSGKKITLTPDDIARLRSMPVTSLTLMPGVRLEDSLLLKRFGKPDQVIRETKGDATHWLYPQHGLDISLSATEKPVMQYVPPRDFGKLVKPLLDGGGQAVSR